MVPPSRTLLLIASVGCTVFLSLCVSRRHGIPTVMSFPIPVHLSSGTARIRIQDGNNPRQVHHQYRQPKMRNSQRGLSRRHHRHKYAAEGDYDFFRGSGEREDDDCNSVLEDKEAVLSSDVTELDHALEDAEAVTTCIVTEVDPSMDLTRRKFSRDMIACATAAIAMTMNRNVDGITMAYPSDGGTKTVSKTNTNSIGVATTTATTPKSKKDKKIPEVKPKASQTSIQSSGINKSLVENNVNVTLVQKLDKEINDAEVYIDHTLFTKVQRKVYPEWVPALFRQSPVPVREITDAELLVSGICAGSLTEIFRLSLLYPLSTIKARIQIFSNLRNSKYKNLLSRSRSQSTTTSDVSKEEAPSLQEKLESIKTYYFTRLTPNGKLFRKLYAGIVPSLITAVPASGLYFGIRDVTKLQLTRALGRDDVGVALVGALIGDIVTLAVRTPAVTYSLRRQVATAIDDEEHDDDAGVAADWWTDSWEQLPVLIITDLPYLLLRIALNLMLSSSDMGIGRYEVVNISVACLCAFLTTPFDVVRTRILVDADGDPSNGLDGGDRSIGVWAMMRRVYEEEGGVGNLYAGWRERTLYFGIGSAWLDPIRVLGYLGVRDAVLLQWFD